MNHANPRERIHERLASKRLGHNEINVKLCQGGIRDIEFLVQCLQRLHGGRERWLRHGGTLLSLFRLRDKGLLSPTEYARLASAYQFFRTLEQPEVCYGDRGLSSHYQGQGLKLSKHFRG